MRDQTQSPPTERQAVPINGLTISPVLSSILRRVRRLARLLVCAATWIVLFNLVAAVGNLAGEWPAFAALLVSAPIVGYATWPLFSK